MTIADRLSCCQLALLLTTTSAALLVAVHSAGAETRRAVLVGIDKYVPMAAVRTTTTVVESSSSRGRPRGAWTDLEGAVNDVDAMRQVLTRFGFRSDDIHVLVNGDATHDRIIAYVRKWLIDAAAPGDASFFFYAGHGSQVRNSKSAEADKLDESIVPADANVGGPDLRDKEIARLFNEALDKKVMLTLAFDSCHSGSISRGQLRPIRFRNVAPDLRDVADPSNPPALESRGALVLSAAQSHQLAGEMIDENHSPHGLFTWALLKMLRSMPVDESAERMFLSLRALMQSANVAQEPDLATTAKRRRASLFGVSNGSVSGATVVAAQSVDKDGTVVLQGGLAAGIRKDCELRSLGDRAENAITIRITEEQGMTASRAVVTTGSAQTIQPGTLFQVVRWAAPNNPTLRVWVGGPDLTAVQVAQEADRFGALGNRSGVTWIDDPTLDTGSTAPTGVIQWNGSAWEISVGGKTTPLVTAGRETILTQVPSDPYGKRRIMLNVPLPVEVKKLLHLGAGSQNDAIEVMPTPAGADYALVGRRQGSVLQYAWVRPLAGENPQQSALPARTGWVALNADRPAAAAQRLEEQALRLGVIRTWLQLESPGNEETFPYHLALRNATTGEMRTTGPARDGETYGLVLAVDQAMIRPNFQSRYVYVFAIDCAGESKLLFPSANAGGKGENYFPPRDESGRAPNEIALGPRQLFKVTAPFGVDTYVMLATATALADPTVVEGEAIRSRDLKRGADDSLTRLLARAGAGKRSPTLTTPTDWMIERLTIESVPASSK